MSAKNKSEHIEICLEILRAWKILKSVIEEFATDHDLTLPQIIVLYQLYSGDHILMGALAKHMHCDASNITGMADRLQTMNLINRREMPADRRAKQLNITDQGRELIEELLPHLPTGLNLSSLSKDEIVELHQLLSKLG